jgi:Tfp pilus assembly protein PilO
MSITQKYTALAIGVAVAVFLAGWFLLVTPKKGEAADLQEQTVAAEAQNVSLTRQIKQLEQKAADLPAQQARLAEFRTRIPDTPALPSLVRSLSDIGAAAGVDVVSLAPANPEAVVAEPTAQTAPAAGASPAPSAAATAPAPTTTTADGSPLVAIPITIEVQGSYFDIEQFVNKAEDLTRAMLITGLVVTPVTDEKATPGTLDAVITARVFMTQAQADAAIAAAAPSAG